MLRTLPIFPSSGFDQSTTTPVLLGVLLSWALTEWFGWVFAGLVVPGYLGAVFLLNPRSAVIDCAEAVATYAVARVLGEHLARTGLTSRLFGRERFFLVVLVSIVIRLATEGWLLPRMAPHATWAFSIGLVVVPLAANACWKTGLGRGVVQNGLPVLLVYLLLRFVFVPYTNLSLAGFELATENIGASFLASPKVYILLLTGATLAAAANLRYGWDFNGILIPALLALVVLEPVKFVATFVEVFVLLGAAALVIRFTPLSRANIEGPRRTVLYFCIDYVLRYLFAFVVGKRLPGSDVVDLMGFGYLLPTLLAVKISQKGHAALVLVPAALVSLAAFVVGTLFGYAGFLLDLRPAAAREEVTRALPAPPPSPAGAGLWVATLARAQPPTDAQTPPLPAATVADTVETAVASAGSPSTPAASGGSSNVLDVQHAGPDALLVRERFGDVQDRVGDPAVLVRAASAGAGTSAEAHRVILYIPTPLASPEAAAYAGLLLGEKLVDAVVVAGIEEPDGRARYESTGRTTARLLADRNGPGLVVALVEGAHPSLVLHAAAAARKNDAASWAVHAAATHPELQLSSTIDDDTRGALDATLEVPASSMDATLAGPNEDLHPLSSAAAMSLTLGELATARYRSEPEDLLALRRMVVEPLLAASEEGRSMPRVRFAARTLGYRLIGPSPLPTGEPGLALVPEGTARPLALVARAAGVRRMVVEVPQADQAEVRDLALRTASLAGADAVLFDLNPSPRGKDGPSMRLAHAAATFPQPGRTPSVVLVRQARAETDQGGVPVLSTWGPAMIGGSADAGAAVSAPGEYGTRVLLEDTRSALARAGLGATLAPIDLQSRELAGRALLGSTPLVVVVADATALRTASLDRARSAARLFDRLGVQSFDGEMKDALRSLLLALPRDLPDGPSDLPVTVERAAIEESVVARERLGQAVARTATRAVYVAAPAGDFLVAAARQPGGTVLFVAASASPTPGAAEAALAVGSPQADVAACASQIARGGTCSLTASHAGGTP